MNQVIFAGNCPVCVGKFVGTPSKCPHCSSSLRHKPAARKPDPTARRYGRGLFER